MADVLALALLGWLALRLRRRLLARDVDHTQACRQAMEAPGLHEAVEALDDLSEAAGRAARRRRD